jgi:type VI secretion system protein VasD
VTSSEHRQNAGGQGAMPRSRRALFTTAWLAAVTVLAGCAGAPKPPKPTQVEGTIAASPGLNPSVNQRPSPLLVRIYELRSPTAFNQADFMSLYQGDQAALAADLVVREEIMLQPGESRPFTRQLNPDTRFIGVIGAYRNLERATWRAVVPIKPNQSQKISVRAEALTLTATALP